MMGREARVECKHYGAGFARLYDWLKGVDMLVLRRDHDLPLAVMPLATIVDLILAADGKPNRARLFEGESVESEEA